MARFRLQLPHIMLLLSQIQSAQAHVTKLRGNGDYDLNTQSRLKDV